ncbi:MAG: malonyl-ACP O-methyltransferase BioC, partial [Gallionella sp.]
MNEFEIDKREVRRAFSKAAAHYDATAVLQREVCSRMLERLDYIKLRPKRILDAGSGTGWGTRQLAQRYPAAQIIALDIAMGMLQIARGRSNWWQKLFDGAKQLQLCADVEALPLTAQSVEMVWSNLTVQWCNDLPATFVELQRVLKVDGLAMFSTLGPDTLKELRTAFDAVDGYNHINRFADMHDIGDMLVAAGFAEPVMDMEYLTLTYDDVKAVMQDLRSIGAHNATAGRAPGMLGKAKWARIVQNYETLRRNGKLPATFEVIYGHAWKVQPKKTADGRAIIQTNFKLSGNNPPRSALVRGEAISSPDKGRVG